MSNDKAKATQQMSEEDLNKVNIHLREQPWYQEWFRSRGLNPNQVKLSEQQRSELSNLAARNGFELGDRMKFDEAGNMNQKGGFAGMPTWAKVAIAAAPVAGAMLIPGAREATLGNLGGIFGGGATSTVAPAATTAATTGATTAATTAAAVPSIMSKIAGFAKTPLGSMVGAGGRMVAQAGAASAANRGTEIDARMAHDQLQLQADRERRDAESDAFRKSLYGQIASGYQPSTRPEGIPSRNPVEGFVTPQAREAGQLMSDIAMNRMKSNDYPTITPFNQLPMKPGLMERIANYAGPAMSLFDPRLYDRQKEREA